MTPKLISVVFSFKNEESNLRELVKRLTENLKKLSNWNYEIIFVNDCSTDNSENILLELQKENPITIINMSRTFGEMPCFLAGFKHCSGDAILYMPADLQDPPELIPELIKKFEEGFEVIHTVRTKRLGEPIYKVFLTKLAYKIINYFSDIKIPINAGDFKLVSKRVLDNILNQKEYRPYMRGLFTWVGFKQTFVSYVRQPRFSGETKYPVFSKGPITEFINGITSYSLKPLYIGIFLGFLSFLIAIIILVFALYLKITNQVIPGLAFIYTAISFFSGSILLTLGILGIYVARIFEETKSRDKYIITEIKKPKTKV